MVCPFHRVWIGCFPSSLLLFHAFHRGRSTIDIWRISNNRSILNSCDETMIPHDSCLFDFWIVFSVSGSNFKFQSGRGNERSRHSSFGGFECFFVIRRCLFVWLLAVPVVCCLLSVPAMLTPPFEADAPCNLHHRIGCGMYFEVSKKPLRLFERWKGLRASSILILLIFPKNREKFSEAIGWPSWALDENRY